MIQRFIYNALVQGLEAVQTQPELLDGLFGELYSLGSEELAAIHTFFNENTPGVIHSYPRTDTELPIYSIVLSSEGESDHILGDDAGMIMDTDDEDFGADEYSSIWDHKYVIFCYSEHPDVTEYMYEVAKLIIHAALKPFSEEGLFSTHLSGSDIKPDAASLPEHLFVRQLTFACKREFQRIDYNSKFTKGFTLSGIHVDSDLESSEGGTSVKSLVTTYVPGDTTDNET